MPRRATASARRSRRWPTSCRSRSPTTARSFASPRRAAARPPSHAADEHGRRELTRRGAASVPDEVSLTYYDVGRDYQAGLQRATRGDGAPGGNADRRALPAALTAEGAKALAAYRLAAAWAGRVTAKVVALLARLRGAAGRSRRPSPARPAPGRSSAGRSGRWSSTLELVRTAPGGLPDPAAASPGQPVSQIDRPHGPTLLHLLDLPLGDGLGNKPLLFVAAAGSEEGWRRAVAEREL